MVSNYTWLRI